MFRSKQKKVGGRKRREAELESGSADAKLSENVHATSVTENLASKSASEAAEKDLQVLEQLRRRRARAVKSAMTFSSKRISVRSIGSSAVSDTATGLQLAETGLLLSFEEDEGRTKQKKKSKMRPHPVASSDTDMDVEKKSNGLYSIEMLAALRRERSVLLSSQTDVVEVEGGNNGDDVEKIVVEEEFISLGGEKKKDIGRTKNRVTFGVHPEGPGISKKVEVVEEFLDGGSEEEEQSKRWEEELMRRGGHRVPQPTESNGTGARDGLPTYPTRRKVTCVSLGSVLGKLEKSVETTLFEDDRASRDLARIEAETTAMETALKQQQEELVISSEEFEFFQEVEDFVKGLSYCLRAKLPIIRAMEEKIVQDRAGRVKGKQQEEQHRIAQDVKYYRSSGKLQLADIVGLSHLNLHSDGHDTAMSFEHVSDHTSRMQKYQQHFTESYVTDPHHAEEDLFADAIDEISSLERVYGRFQEWKAKFPNVYRDVYCELAQEKLFAPYVQAEMLSWDPLGVADAHTELGKSWSFYDFAWFRVLHQHPVQSGNGGRRGGNIDGPILYLIRDVLLGKVHAATLSYFDPYSSLQTRSLSLILEEIDRQRYGVHVEEALQIFVSTVLKAFCSEAERTVLVAIDQNAVTSGEDVNLFARYLLERFNALQDNLLTLFVALPKGTIAASGFRCLLQVLQPLLAYVRLCEDTRKTQLVATATQVVRQLSGSSYLLQHLSEPSQERELMHILELFEPFLHTTQ